MVLTDLGISNALNASRLASDDVMLNVTGGAGMTKQYPDPSHFIS